MGVRIPHQIELDGGQAVDQTGDVVVWEQPVLFRHMITRRYLAMRSADGVQVPYLIDVKTERDRVRRPPHTHTHSQKHRQGQERAQAQRPDTYMHACISVGAVMRTAPLHASLWVP
jgi:hypothetical protein